MALRCGIRELALLAGMLTCALVGTGNWEAAAKSESSGIATETNPATVKLVSQVHPEFGEDAVAYLRLRLLVLATDPSEPFSMKIWLVDEIRYDDASVGLLDKDLVSRVSLYPMVSIGEERNIEIALARRDISSDATVVHVALESTIEGRRLVKSAVEIKAATLSDIPLRAN